MTIEKGPRAERKISKFKIHGEQLQDPYGWLKEKKNPKVLNILKNENKHFEVKISKYKSTTKQIFQELKKRIPEAEDTVPYKRGDLEFFYRYKKGAQYFQYCCIQNKKAKVLLDLNKLVGKSGYLSTGEIAASRDGKYLAYAIDTKGSELYDLVIVDIKSKKEVSRIKNTSGDFVWSNIHMIYYMTIDGHLRADKAWRHIIGETKKDQCIFTEKEKNIFSGLQLSSSRKYLIIGSGEKTSSYASFVEVDSKDQKATTFLKRKDKIEYSIDHIHDSFFIKTNEKAVNFNILMCHESTIDKKNWKVIVSHNSKILIEGFTLTASCLVVYERSGGLPKIRVFELFGKKSYYVTFLDSAYIYRPMGSFEFEDDKLRISYSSLIRPETIIDIDLLTQKQKIRKIKKIKDFDSKKYKLEFVFVDSHDKKKIPMCIVYRKNIKIDGQNPGFVYSYGSYGHSMQPSFDASLISLMDRGFVFASVGIRGGSDMGRSWYEGGKFLNKKNTFSDFISATEHLVKAKYISKDKIAAEGASAGGMLMGAITNMRPDLYKIICAHVPFVDVLNTMFDTSLPLTTTEYNEWGNPNLKKFFKYMKSYSPYDNVTDNFFPHMYVTAGLNDQRVTYWEPAKWVQKLRDHNLGDNDVLLKVNMGEGHFGKSGRYNSIMETAEQYAYMVHKIIKE